MKSYDGLYGLPWNILVERREALQVNGQRYHVQLWEGFPKFDDEKTSTESCVFVYDKQTGETTIGQSGLEILSKIEENFAQGAPLYHIALCRDITEGKVQVDYIEARIAYTPPEPLILDLLRAFPEDGEQ